MGTFGKDSLGGNLINVSADYKQVSPATLTEDGTVTKLTAYIGGGGGGSPSQVLRTVVYSEVAGEPSALLIRSDERTVLSADSPQWLDFTLPASVPLTAGNYWIGLHAGATNATIRIDSIEVSNKRKYNSDVYSNGTADPFAAVATTDATWLSIYATYTAAAEKQSFYTARRRTVGARR